MSNTRVEEELKDFTDKKVHISQIHSEAGKKVHNKKRYKNTLMILLKQTLSKTKL
ncbi:MULTISPECIES: hypothetical protein [unclassified Bartonella]|uniref:hypothetical protein n=1 Tax=unclassified Bartonella TaxID=2645622 RepID=UPI0035CEF404